MQHGRSGCIDGQQLSPYIPRNLPTGAAYWQTIRGIMTTKVIAVAVAGGIVAAQISVHDFLDPGVLLDLQLASITIVSTSAPAYQWVVGDAMTDAFIRLPPLPTDTAAKSN